MALGTSALWGGTPVAIHFSTDTLPPVMVAALRFALAALFMLFWCRLEGSGLVASRAEWRPILLCSLLLYFQIVSFNLGVAGTSSSHGSLFINTFIFWVAPIEQFVLRSTRLNARQWLGMLLAGLAGISALVIDVPAGANEATTLPGAGAPRDLPTLWGDLVLVGSGFLLAVKIVYTRHAVSRVAPGRLILWHDLLGTLLFLASSLLFETTSGSDFTSAAIWGLLYQGLLVGGLCFAVQAAQLKRHSASQIAVFSASTPLFGILAGSLLRGDPLSPWLTAAGLGVAWGIVLVTRAN
jgi:drug/metabolite transporter (DMT)-like permease